jgi:hypothetical protein
MLPCFSSILSTSFEHHRKIATLDKSLAKGLLGRLAQFEVADLNSKLKILLQLP